jgi:hypothetical protein
MGLIVLAVALAVLLTTGAPVANSETGVKLSDWLGFAGNILGALVTLVAAYIAWRAVQRQIGAERNATLLDVTTREEDRLEAELHAISALEDLYAVSVLQLQKVTNPYDHLQKLQAIGFSPSLSETREALRDRTGGPVPPLMLETFAQKYATLTGAVDRLNDIQNRINMGYSDPALPAAKQTMETTVKRVEADISSTMGELYKRKEVITGKLLPAYRSRIEAGLRAIQD